jgi:hypothetical protein
MRHCGLDDLEELTRHARLTGTPGVAFVPLGVWKSRFGGHEPPSVRKNDLESYDWPISNILAN